METLGGMDEGEVDGQGVSAAIRAAAKAELSEDDRMAQDLFGIVVSRRHAVDVEESEDAVVFAFWVQEPLAEVFRFRVMARGFTDLVKGVVKSRDFGLRLSKGKLAEVSEAGNFTGL